MDTSTSVQLPKYCTAIAYCHMLLYCCRDEPYYARQTSRVDQEGGHNSMQYIYDIVVTSS